MVIVSKWTGENNLCMNINRLEFFQRYLEGSGYISYKAEPLPLTLWSLP